MVCDDLDPQRLLELALALAGNHSVTRLLLHHQVIGDEGVRILAESLHGSSVVWLGLGFNKIGDDGAGVLAAALQGSAVTSLDLSSNNIGDEGAKALAAALQSSGISQLNLFQNLIGEKGARALLDGVRTSAVTALELGFNRCSTTVREEILAAIAASKAPSLVLQVQVNHTQTDLKLTLRTVGGSIAAILQWDLHQPVQDLPAAAWTAIRSSGFRMPESVSCKNLRLVLPNGVLLDTVDEAPYLAQQLGLL